MERRQFLQTGAAAGALGMAGVGCSAAQSRFEVPGVAELLSLDMEGFLRRLDSSLGFLRSTSSLGELIPAPVARRAEEDERFSGSEALLRDSLRSLLLTSSFGELPEAGQAHPGCRRARSARWPSSTTRCSGCTAR